MGFISGMGRGWCRRTHPTMNAGGKFRQHRGAAHARCSEIGAALRSDPRRRKKWGVEAVVRRSPPGRPHRSTGTPLEAFRNAGLSVINDGMPDAKTPRPRRPTTRRQFAATLRRLLADLDGLTPAPGARAQPFVEDLVAFHGQELVELHRSASLLWPYVRPHRDLGNDPIDDPFDESPPPPLTDVQREAVRIGMEIAARTVTGSRTNEEFAEDLDTLGVKSTQVDQLVSLVAGVEDRRRLLNFLHYLSAGIEDAQVLRELRAQVHPSGKPTYKGKRPSPGELAGLQDILETLITYTDKAVEYLWDLDGRGITFPMLA
jgi:hypothetical protein